MNAADPGTRAAVTVVAAGVCAALHVGKLAPAVDALQLELGLTLVQAGFLLSLVQGAGMLFGLLMGSWCDGLGARRSMLTGLALQAVSSAAGSFALGAGWLLGWRALEGLGFLMVVLPAPGLLRQLTPPARVRAMLGTWGAFMPAGVALALLSGPPVIQALGWRGWWLALAALSVAMALVLVRWVPASARMPVLEGSRNFGGRVALTLRHAGPWLVALTFAVYSSQWLAVVGFMPTIVAGLGLPPLAAGLLAAGVAAANIVGNAASGRLQERGVPAARLLAFGFVAMALGAWLAFAEQASLPAAARYAAVVAFSMVGGLIPGTLFSLAVQVAPHGSAVSTTVGWMQQWSAAGQCLGPPAVAAVASAAGGWQWTWLATGACSAVGLVLAALVARR